VVANIEVAGRWAITVQVYIGVEGDFAGLFAAVDDEFGVLTGLVNCAGVIGPHGRLDDLAQDDTMKDPAAYAHEPRRDRRRHRQRIF